MTKDEYRDTIQEADRQYALENIPTTAEEAQDTTSAMLAVHAACVVKIIGFYPRETREKLLELFTSQAMDHAAMIYGQLGEAEKNAMETKQ